MTLPANWNTDDQYPASAQNALEALVNTHTAQIAALGGGPAPTASGAAGVVDFGFNQSEIGHETWYTTGEIETILEGMRAAGATRVRFAAWWGAFEPSNRGVYDWDGLDRCLDLVEEYGLIPSAVITSPGPTYSTPTVADYANACGDLADRYGAAGTNQLHNYEIWNEANHRSFYVPFGTDTTVPYSDFGAAHYTTVLIAAANAIRAADSQAFIITTGLMSTVDFAPDDILPSTFLQGVYNAGGKNYFDAVGFHWYSNEPDFTGWNEPTTDEVFYTDLLDCRDIMVAEGDTNKKMWITELGYPEPELTALVRAEWQAKQIELIRELAFVESFYLYNYRCTDASMTGSSQYGAVTFDFEKRQPYYDTVHSMNSATKTPPEGGVTGSHIAVDSIDVTHIDATGTPSGTTFYRGDGAWGVPSGVGGGSGADWNTNLTNIPATFPPETHTHDYSSGVTGKPTTFAPSTHSHTNIDTTMFAGSALVTASEGLASSDNDTSVPTTAAVIDAIAAVPGGGGGSLVGYGTAVGAVTADTPVTITHNLSTRNVSVVVRRTHLVAGGLTDTTAGEAVGVKWRVTTANAITLDPSENWAANEFFCTVSPVGVTDTATPTAPTLSTTGQTESTISLSWTAGTGSIAGYNVYRPAGGILIATTPVGTTTYVDTALTGSTPYTYTVKSFNLMGAESGASNTVSTNTTAASNAVLDTVGAGNRVTGTNTITASQVVTAGSNKHMVAWVIISQNNWVNAAGDFSAMTLTSSLSGAMTKLSSLPYGVTGQNQASIHMYELDNPATGTHTLTLGSVYAGVGTAASIIILSGSYHNVASVANVTTSATDTGLNAVNQTVTSAVGSLAVCGLASEGTIAGFNKTTRDSDGGLVTGSGDFGLYGEAAGATSVNFTTTSNVRYGFIGANLAKA